jgi:hypothetical protein
VEVIGMREINVEEKYKYDVIDEIMKSDKPNINYAATKLCLTPRSIRNLIKVYKTQGKSGFIHKNTGKAASNKTSEKNKITNIGIKKN